MPQEQPRWLLLFEPQRQRPEIEFNRVYAEHYHHGTAGHNERLIMARLARLLDELETVPEAAAKIEELILKGF